MDLFRYFHPHHNPRLRQVPLRAQEVSELELAAVELQRAIERAAIRMSSLRGAAMAATAGPSGAPSGEERHPEDIGGITALHFEQLLVAANYLVESLAALAKAHPGDDEGTMRQLLKERQDAPGWENWARLVTERLKLTA